MFIHKNRKVGGYKFRQKTWYTAHHLGTDWSAYFEELYAPCNGKVIATPNGPEGGQWLWFEETGTEMCKYFKADKLIHRFGHLKEIKIPAGTEVKEGDVLAITGNSGRLTKSPHNHHDISINKVILSDIDNFIDPEVYFDVMDREQQASEWAKEAIEWNKKMGIMEDTSRPLDNITRQEQAVINQRMYDLIMQEVKKLV